MTLLTNWAADTFAEARVRFPFLERPRGVTVSGEIKMIKPDRGIFEHHAKAFGLARLTEHGGQRGVNPSRAIVDGPEFPDSVNRWSSRCGCALRGGVPACVAPGCDFASHVTASACTGDCA